MRIYSLIPARGGSKRVPNKNIKLLNSKPLIEYTINHSFESDHINSTFVSSDSDEILNFALKKNCKTLKRPDKYSTDHATTKSVIKHFLENFKKGQQPSILCLLQPCIPFRRKNLIDECISKLIKFDMDSVVTHIKVDMGHPNRLKRLKANYLTHYDSPEIEDIPRSELPEVYYRDGSVYVFKTESFLNYDSLFGRKQGYVINDPSFHVNIDNLIDWYCAEALIKNLD